MCVNWCTKTLPRGLALGFISMAVVNKWRGTKAKQWNVISESITLHREEQLSIVQTNCPCSMSTALFLQQTLMTLSMNDMFVMMVHSNHRILKDLFYTILNGKERRKCYFLIKCTELFQLMQSISYSQDGASADFWRTDFNMVKRS